MAALCAAVVMLSQGIAAAAGTWQKAIEVPGTASLNAGGSASISSVSCASAGNCSAGGYYLDGSGHEQTFVVNEANGTWQKAIEVPGTASLNTGGSASINSVSCTSAGNCSAGGSYIGSSGQEASIVNEVNGTWQKAIEVPGTASLNKAGDAWVVSVSCASAGNCSAGGYYYDTLDNHQAFVVNEVDGTWQKAIKMPGVSSAQFYSISCASAGNCSAGGSYGGYPNVQAFIVNEVNGTWHKAIEVPGTSSLNAGASAATASVSCASAGNCSAGGFYFDGSGHEQTFVVNEVDGIWQKAIEVPGTATLNTYGFDSISSVSCASAGNCSAGGSYTDSSNHYRAFVVNDVNGTWHKAIEVPGTATLNTFGAAQVASVSCASPENCSAGGSYVDSSGHAQIFS